MVSITDVPTQPRPEVRRYAVEVRDCRVCGRKIRGQHPDIGPGQHGATAHRVGPRVRAMAHALHYLHGVPVRKTPAILEELTGVRLTQGAITQDAMKQSEGAVGATYGALRRIGFATVYSAYRRYGMARGRKDSVSDGVCQPVAFGLSDTPTASQ
jgi:hypothetical protein